MAAAPAKPTFFATPADFRRWFQKHHASSTELYVGFYKKGSAKPSISWPESVDEALCFGWIDGVRKSLGDESYMIRFTPRQAKSIWSAVNIRRAKELIELGRMQDAGLAAFQKRDEKRMNRYSFEQEDKASFPAEFEQEFRRNKKAWKYFEAQPPFYRRTTTWWVISARREETRRRRLEALIADSAAGCWVKPMRLGDKKQS
jgi:uncharacterized protein YdeI (YjbR/CyaY-like superfamily)